MSEEQGETKVARTTGAPPWVLVAGGFHARGGMDKANAALARHLVARGHALHLVAHEVAREFARDPRVKVHIVPRPAGSVLLGEPLLARRGKVVAEKVLKRWPGARVVANGGNYVCRDVNWVHAVHRAWPVRDEGAPLWFRAKNRLMKTLARRRERRAIQSARVVVANSERTRRTLIEHLGIPASRVHTVYLGGDAAGEPTLAERNAARAWLGVEEGRPIVAFVGALGHDRNKGFDTLWRAWASLCERTDWDAQLVVAGGGRGSECWPARAKADGLAARVTFLGFTERVADLLAASDVLVSPARYEAYGLNVHEAICRGVPALVSNCAGIAELFPPGLSEMVLPDAEDAHDLAARLLRWRGDVKGWRARFTHFAARLRERTWDDLAAEFVAVVEADAPYGAMADEHLLTTGTGFAGVGER